MPRRLALARIEGRRGRGQGLDAGAWARGHMVVLAEGRPGRRREPAERQTRSEAIVEGTPTKSWRSSRRPRSDGDLPAPHHHPGSGRPARGKVLFKFVLAGHSGPARDDAAWVVAFALRQGWPREANEAGTVAKTKPAGEVARGGSVAIN